MPFYEYYFEPSGKNGMVVFQFMHTYFDEGMKVKKHIETMINFAQYLFILLFIIGLILFSINKIVGLIVIISVGLLFNTRFLNPLGVQYQHWKATKQMIMG
jgi:Zn-dependent membrane protease YugP